MPFSGPGTAGRSRSFAAQSPGKQRVIIIIIIIQCVDNDLGKDVPLGHNGEYEGVLTVGELTRLVWVLPRVVFLNYISDH